MSSAQLPPVNVKVPSLLGHEIQAITKNLRRYTDREAAIVGRSLVEAALEEAIKSRLIKKPDGRLFNKNGPLHSFYTKLIVAHSFGVISLALRQNLELINDIRNNFAHSVRPIRFDTPNLKPDIKTSCSNLKLPENYREEIKWLINRTYNSDKTENRGGASGKIMLLDEFNFIMAEYRFSRSDLKISKGRYIVSVNISWIYSWLLVIRQN